MSAPKQHVKGKEKMLEHAINRKQGKTNTLSIVECTESMYVVVRG
jgi:hypothetical protein